MPCARHIVSGECGRPQPGQQHVYLALGGRRQRRRKPLRSLRRCRPRQRCAACRRRAGLRNASVPSRPFGRPGPKLCVRCCRAPAASKRRQPRRPRRPAHSPLAAAAAVHWPSAELARRLGRRSLIRRPARQLRQQAALAARLRPRAAPSGGAGFGASGAAAPASSAAQLFGSKQCRACVWHWQCVQLWIRAARLHLDPAARLPLGPARAFPPLPRARPRPGQRWRFSARLLASAQRLRGPLVRPSSFRHTHTLLACCEGPWSRDAAMTDETGAAHGPACH